MIITRRFIYHLDTNLHIKQLSKQTSNSWNRSNCNKSIIKGSVRPLTIIPQCIIDYYVNRKKESVYFCHDFSRKILGLISEFLCFFRYIFDFEFIKCSSFSRRFLRFLVKIYSFFVSIVALIFVIPSR